MAQPQEQLINLKDPDTGEIGSLPASQAQQALAQGFSQVSPDELDAHFKEEKYGTTGQQIATGLEGAASSATFGLSTGLERAAGVPGEDIRARREVNPGSHMAGELGGLGVGMLYGAGEAAALEKAGAAVAGRIAGESALSKIGSTAAKLATENALFAGGDEASKLFSGDPNQSVGTAMADVGLAGLIGAGTGAAFGSVSPLWKATVGDKVGSVLNGLKNKAGGIEGQLSQPVNEALDRAGVDLSPEVKAALSDDPMVQQAAKTLEQSDTTKSGMAYQESLRSAKNDLSQSMVGTLGRDAAHVEKLPELSKYEAGKEVGNALADDVAARVDPLAKEFEELKGKVGNVDLVPDSVQETPRLKANPQDLVGVPQTEIERVSVPGTTSQIGEKIAKLSMEQGWNVAEDTPIANLLGMVQKNLPRLNSLKDLTNFISRVGEKGESLASLTDRSPTRAAGMIKGILKDAEADIIASKLGEKGPELVDRFQAVRGAWKEASGLVNDIEEHIGVRASTSGYAKAIREMAQQDGEALLRRIAGNGNAAGLKLLEEQFPKAAQVFRDFHIDSILKAAADKAGPGQLINPKALINGMEKLSPEMREFVLPNGAADKIRAVGTLLEQFEKAPHNFSNTARTLDKLNQHVHGGAVAIAGALMGHPIAGAVLAPLFKLLTKDAPDAVRLAALKFVGSSQPIESGAFKAMVDMAGSIQKGEVAVTRGARAVLREGGKLPSKKDIADNDRTRLDKQLMALKENPAGLMHVASDLGHYMPDHATAVAATAAQAVNYLNSLRPDTDRKMPLDAKLPADPAKTAAFHRALDIAHNPLIVFESVKNGTVTPNDLAALQNVAPGLYMRMRDKLNSELISFTSEEKDIPYKTRLGMALFLGQPLDSTMTPAGIMAAQPKNQAMPQQQQMASVKPSATSMQQLKKIGTGMATGEQAREMSRTKHLT